MKLSNLLPQALRRHLFMNEATYNAVANLWYNMKADKLTDLALNSTKRGISDQNFGHELIVSLTTYGSRLHSVHTIIESIMQGSLLPNRIVLWVDEKLKDKPLPIALQHQMTRGLEVAYCTDIRSYTKLLPALRKFPKADIITIDDDVIYNFDLVESLVNAHVEYPDCIVARRCHRIVLGGKEMKPVAYNKWLMGGGYQTPTYLNFFTGGGGAYYPAGSLDPEVLNEDVFLSICPLADDVWFNAMAIKSGTRIMRAYASSPVGDDFLVSSVLQAGGLCQQNVVHGENDRQIKAVFEKYDLFGVLREEKERVDKTIEK